MKRLKIGSAEFNAGIFIIISLALLLFSILWLRHFAFYPEMSVIARFKDPGPVDSGMLVYYQGVNVGKVSEVGFSEDYKYTYVYIDIFNKDLKLPANITAEIKIQGIAGQKFVCLSFPENPSVELLASGDIIEGEVPFGIEDLQAFLKKQIESGNLQKMFEEIDKAITNANNTTLKMGETSEQINRLFTKHDEEINGIILSTTGATEEFNQAMANVNSIVKSREFQENIKDTVKNANQLLQNTEFGTRQVFDQIQTTRLIPNLNNTVWKAYSAMDEAEQAFRVGGQTAQRYDCIGKNFSRMMNQRFLFFKLMFGNPGEPLEACEGCYP